MAAVDPGSTLFKQYVESSLVEIRFKLTGVVACTIGVVVAKTDSFCYLIAPITKFQHYAHCRVVVQLPCGAEVRIKSAHMFFNGEIAGCYLFHHEELPFRAIEITDAQAVQNQTVYLFSYKLGGEVLSPGNITFAAGSYFKHDCPCQKPLVEIEKDNVVLRTVVKSGEVIFDADRRLIGIVREIDLTDRTVTLNTTAIRQYILLPNENWIDFVARVIALAYGNFLRYGCRP